MPALHNKNCNKIDPAILGILDKCSSQRLFINSNYQLQFRVRISELQCREMADFHHSILHGYILVDRNKTLSCQECCFLTELGVELQIHGSE